MLYPAGLIPWTFVAVIFSLNLASPFSKFLPVALVNEPEPAAGKEPVNSFLTVPSLLKYCGVGVFTAET